MYQQKYVDQLRQRQDEPFSKRESMQAPQGYQQREYESMQEDQPSESQASPQKPLGQLNTIEQLIARQGYEEGNSNAAQTLEPLERLDMFISKKRLTFLL